MKDDLVEQLARALAEADSAVSSYEELARAVLVIARPAILEEAAQAIQCGCCDVCGEDPDYEHVCASALAIRVRALATTGQEGGR